MTVDEVVEQVARHAEGWLTVRAEAPARDESATQPGDGGFVLRLCGPRPAGLSAVGFQVYRRLRLAGFRAAYLDLEQVGFLRPQRAADPGGHRFKAANLASAWRVFRASGADCLVAVGEVEDADARAAYTAASPRADLVVCRASLVPGERAADEVAREILAKITVPHP